MQGKGLNASRSGRRVPLTMSATSVQIDEGRGLFGARLFVHATLPSTNRWIIENAGDHEHGDVVRAERQTDGRGRAGRSWLAPEDRGLTLSVAVRDTDPGLAPNLTQAAAIAVRRTLSAYEIASALKWPNDVMATGDMKIAGILAERSPTENLVALGIGLNVNLSDTDFAGIVLRQPASSMNLVAGGTYDVAQVCEALLHELEQVLNDLLTHGRAALITDWTAFDWLGGHRVIITDGDARVEGVCGGLADDGRLRLTDEAGREHLFWSGDAERLGPA